MSKYKISLVAPAYNEQGNLKLLVSKITSSLKKLTPKYEIIIVDDGSTDNSITVLKNLKKTYPSLKIIKLRRRSGQTSALMAGFKHAQGEIIVTIDADLQQDPQDILKLVKAIDKNTDVVTGVRPHQNRSFIYSLISSIEKLLIKTLLGIDLADFNVSPNAFKSSSLNDVQLFGEMHRFLVPILSWKGYQVKAVPVSFHQRHTGQSKYKPTKAIRGFLDLFIVKFWQDYSARPMHVLGGLGLSLVAIGGLIGLFTAIRKFIFHSSLFNVSLLLLTVFLFIIGLQFFILGILADIMVRTYYQNKQSFDIEQVL
jgi:glycosyltransferase involved in cell wall biosynthesis